MPFDVVRASRHSMHLPNLWSEEMPLKRILIAGFWRDVDNSGNTDIVVADAWVPSPQPVGHSCGCPVNPCKEGHPKGAAGGHLRLLSTHAKSVSRPAKGCERICAEIRKPPLKNAGIHGDDDMRRCG